MYKALDLAKYIVAKCIDDRCPISNLQLQKILYYIQKEFLIKTDTPAFGDAIEAWQFGPVVPNVYYDYCSFGSMPISWAIYESELNSYDDEKIIDTIIEQKRSLHPWNLVADTHKPNGAWDQIYKNGVGNHEEIPIELIKSAG